MFKKGTIKMLNRAQVFIDVRLTAVPFLADAFRCFFNIFQIRMHYSDANTPDPFPLQLCSGRFVAYSRLIGSVT